MLPDIGNTKLGLCDLFDGCVGEGGGREVKREGAYVCLWPIHVDISQKLSQYCNVIILPFKIILKKKYWRDLPFPSPMDFPNPGIKPVRPVLAGRFFIAEPPGKQRDWN